MDIVKMEVKMRPYQRQVSPTSSDECPGEERETGRHRGAPEKATGCWSAVSASQGSPGVTTGFKQFD